MSSMDAIREGKLELALQYLQQEVRQQPAEQKHRVFLFQLYAVLGQWDKALTQLNLAGELEVANLHMMHAYRELLQCEALRSSIFEGQRSPLVFGDPMPWIAQLIEALRLDGELHRSDHGAHASQLRQAAMEGAPVSSGSINGEPFQWIADADSRLGPMLELVMNGRYYWVPFARIKSIRIEAPVDLRDRVWMPAHITWSNEGEAVGFIPTRYAGTAEIAENNLRLACQTVWRKIDETSWQGLGQRIFCTDLGEYALMDVRTISIDQPVVNPTALPVQSEQL